MVIRGQGLYILTRVFCHYQFMQATYEEHMETINRILRYLKTTLGKGLIFRKTNGRAIEAYIELIRQSPLLTENPPPITVPLSCNLEE